MSDLLIGKYRHYKGMKYEVIGIAKHSETLEELVVYRALYGNHQLWIRPKEMFFEKILKDGNEILRFEYMGNTNE
jgi:cyclomaltodextrinase